MADIIDGLISGADPQAVKSLARRALKIKAARENLKDLIEYCMVDPDEIKTDPLATRYHCARHHELILEQYTKTITGRLLRSALSIPPQHGKTTIVAEYGIAFFAAKNQTKNIIYGTYSSPRAKIVGDKVRSIMESHRFKEVFPDFKLRTGTQSKEVIGFEAGGSVMFVGRNSGQSGNPCDLFIIDDPFKDRREARSPAIREEVWDWYCSVVEARCPVTTPVFIIHTRWTDDDLIGRLCDPDHPKFDPDENDNFEYLNLPAVIEPGDTASADKIGLTYDVLPQALWPGTEKLPRWPLDLLRRIQKKNPIVFAAVFQGRPQPPEGTVWTKSMIRYYRSSALNGKKLRNYGASDHAVSTAKRADPSVLGIAQVDADGNVYIHRDLVWDKIPPDKQVDQMARLMKTYRPLLWWSEGDHIKKAIGPFLRLRLKMQKIFTTIMRELPKHGDKVEKSESILGMAALGMVYLPEDAPWCQKAVDQLLRFDGSEGRPDDFCDFLANIGRGLNEMVLPAQSQQAEEKMPATGTAAWVKMAGQADAAARARAKKLAGW